ncbi:MAG: N-acetylmuramoyl-L-alanine amidase family protein [Eubacteriales bacterium]|nr:N-acetylmuramoyl-L-alanine amidase [Clostridiales bacterium]
MAIKIYIDQGHNPVNPNAGAEAHGLREQDLVYEIGVLLADLLRANGNFEVMLSRNTPDEIIGTSNLTSLQIRVNEANSWPANFFISLHTNASTNPAATGTEALAYSRASQGYVMGDHITRWVSRLTGLRNRGVMLRPGLYVLRNTNMPAVIAELGFITNLHDATLLSQQPDLFAEALYRAILEYYGL